MAWSLVIFGLPRMTGVVCSRPRLAPRPEAPGPLGADSGPCRLPAGAPAPVKHPRPAHARHSSMIPSATVAMTAAVASRAGTSRWFSGRAGGRARRVHPQPDRAASGHAGADRDPAGPRLPVRRSPPGQDQGIAEKPAAGGGGLRRGLQQDGGNLMPGALSPELGGRRAARPADGRHRQEGRTDQEHREQHDGGAGRDSVGAPPQRVAVQAQLARDPRSSHAGHFFAGRFSPQRSCRPAPWAC